MRDQFAQLDVLHKIKTPIAGFLGVVSATYEVEYIDGTAFSVLPGGLLIDMKGIQISGSWRIDQPAAASNKHFELLGHIGSSLEHEVWQELTGYDAVSTVRGIQMALTNGGGVALLNPKKNAGIDTLPAAYTSFGFATTYDLAGQVKSCGEEKIFLCRLFTARYLVKGCHYSLVGSICECVRWHLQSRRLR